MPVYGHLHRSPPRCLAASPGMASATWISASVISLVYRSHVLTCHFFPAHVQVQKAAGRIYYDWNHGSERPDSEKVEDEVAKFEQGIYHAQLVVFQLVAFGSTEFSKKLRGEYNQTQRPLGRTSSRLRG